MSCVDPGSYVSAEGKRANAAFLGAMAKEAVLVAQAIDNYKNLRKSYKEENKIAKRAQENSEIRHSRLTDEFWPNEVDFLEEFGSRDATLEGATTRGRRHAGRLTATVARQFAKKVREVDINASRYATSAKSKALQDLFIMRSSAVSTAKVTGRMMGFSDAQRAKDLDDERRIKALGLKDSLMGVAPKLYKSSANTYAGVGQMLAGDLNRTIEAAGFVWERARQVQETSDANIRAAEGMEDMNLAQARALENQPTILPDPKFSDDSLNGKSVLQMNQIVGDQILSTDPAVPFSQINPTLPINIERQNDAGVGFRDKSLIPAFPVGGVQYIDMIPAL